MPRFFSHPRFLRAAFALALLGAIVGMRWPASKRMIWSLDEGSTFTMAEQILHGEVSYLNSADNRNPLTQYLQAAVFAVAGSWNATAQHVFVAILLGFAAILIWQLARRLGEERTGVAAALWFALLSFNYLAAYDAMAAHTGWYLVLFSCLGFWLFAVAWTRARLGVALAAGIAFGLSFLAKQPGLLDFAVPLVILALFCGTDGSQRRKAFLTAAALAGGFALPVVVTIVYFAAHGALRDLIFYSWTYNTKYYVPEVPLLQRLLVMRMPFILAWNHSPVTLCCGLLGAAGLLAAAFKSLRHRPVSIAILPGLILGWAAAGLASTGLSGRTFDHYCMQFIPPLSLACGWITARVAAWVRDISRRRKFAGVMLGILSAVLIVAVAWPAVNRARHLELGEEIDRRMGADLRSLTRPDDRILVWGYVPELYFFSHRLPATRFIYTNYLTGLIPWTNLDPEKNTDYAIIPDGWNDFWRDWETHPPAVVVDTRALRGYRKYPLEQQARLWAAVERDYAEIAPDRFGPRGYRVYRRADAAQPVMLNPSLPVNDAVEIEDLDFRPLADRRYTVSVPAGGTALEFYVDGRLYRRVPLALPAAQQVTFTVLASEVPAGRHELRAAWLGARPVVSPPCVVITGARGIFSSAAVGPSLVFEGGLIPPAESVRVEAGPVVQPVVWEAEPSSHLIYPRRPDMDQVKITYNLRAPAAGVTGMDRCTVTAYFEEEGGDLEKVFMRRLDPAHRGSDRGRQTDQFALPPGKSGRLVLTMNQTSANGSGPGRFFWESVAGYRGLLGIQQDDRTIYPERSRSPYEITPMEFRERKVVMAHAPSLFEFPVDAGMIEVTGRFGLLDSAWTGSKKTIGAVFEIIQVGVDGKERMLMQRSLDPANHVSDRGLADFKIKLPSADGHLRFITRSPNAAINDYCYTFWQGLTAQGFFTTLHFDGREIPSFRAASANGISSMDEDGHAVVMAHVPSVIDFPLEPGMRHLSAHYGLLRRAYTGGNATAGAVFVVEVQEPDGRQTELFRKFIDPVHEGAHQQPQTLDLDLPADATGKLVLRTEPSPSGSIAWAWSYWGDLAASK
jgi:4-amino-4-deoxy-L-arabinose transferase-like glycosyltransferase